MAVIELTNGQPDGHRFGQSSTEKISFYGATPVVRPNSIGVIAVTATTTAANTALIAVMSALNTLGIVASA